MKNPNPHDGYAPDLFSEHARAAQLGLRVRDLLIPLLVSGKSKPRKDETLQAWERRRSMALGAIVIAAANLGMLETEARQ